ncbi:MAG: glycosyltransferase [Candidatus Omnitrophica bacterium]|nr:glycosyltransferase [Candidatus Omnitrophota bacterium]
MKNLVIFAKEPKKHDIKTRLSSFLSDTDRVDLYKAFLKDTVNLAKSVKCDRRIMAYDSRSKNPGSLKKIAPRFKFYRQKGKDLGRRMHNAFRNASKDEDSKTLIIGSDAPNLPSDLVKKAFRKLEKNDLVLGPSRDGGYYLIGLKKPCGALFSNIKWSSQEVLGDTLKKAKRLKKKVALLDKWYDVDTPLELFRLVRDLKKNKKSAKWTRRFLKI